MKPIHPTGSTSGSILDKNERAAKNPRTHSAPELTVLIPCHNGAQKIENAILDWAGALEQVTSYEIVVINDGSQDGSARILDSLRREHPTLRVIHQLHTGASTAIRRGYEAARGTYVLELPLDGFFEPQHFWALWERRLSYQLLIAFSDAGKTAGGLKGLTGRMLERWLQFLFGANLRSGVSNFRLARTSIIAPMMKRLPQPFENVGYGISLLVHKEYPFGIREVPVPANLGSPVAKPVVAALEALQLWWSTRRPWFRRRKLKTSP